MEEKFNYTYSAPTESERREIESIRNSYLTQGKEDKSKLQRLISLDKKVKNTANGVAISVGIVGLLVFGLGMSMAMEWSLYVWGTVVALVGCAVMGVAYPLMRFILKKLKKKYSQEILQLSEELLNG
ncbi:MAG: hypothetical protein ACI4MN_04565 [Candidatus Coproplasma sp.]